MRLRICVPRICVVPAVPLDFLLPAQGQGWICCRDSEEPAQAGSKFFATAPTAGSWVHPVLRGSSVKLPWAPLRPVSCVLGGPNGPGKLALPASLLPIHAFLSVINGRDLSLCLSFLTSSCSVQGYCSTSINTCLWERKERIDAKGETCYKSGGNRKTNIFWVKDMALLLF